MNPTSNHGAGSWVLSGSLWPSLLAGYRPVGAKNDGSAVDDYVGIVVIKPNGHTSKRSRFE
jgi:hypothetical protein